MSLGPMSLGPMSLGPGGRSAQLHVPASPKVSTDNPAWLDARQKLRAQLKLSGLLRPTKLFAAAAAG